MPKEPNKASVDEQAIRDQAADWMVRLAEREMSYVEHLRYLEWLRRSPVHFE